MESQTMSELQNLYLSASGMDEFQFRSGVSETAPMPGDQAPWMGGEPASTPWMGGAPASTPWMGGAPASTPWMGGEPASTPWMGGEPASIGAASVGQPLDPGMAIDPPGTVITPGPAMSELTESLDAATTMAMSDQSGAHMVGDGLWFDLG